MTRNKIFRLQVGSIECYVRAKDEATVRTLLTHYGIQDFTVARAPGKSKCATSVWECVRDKLRKQ